MVKLTDFFTKKMQKIGLVLSFLFLSFFYQNSFAAEITSISGGGMALIDENNLSETTSKKIEDLVLSGDFGTNETLTINFDSGGSGALNFSGSGSSINFVTTSGNVKIANITGTSEQISFEASGNGTLELKEISIFIEDSGSEIFEKRKLKINLENTDYFGQEFVIDTVNYEKKGNFLGKTGGTNNDIFKIGDNLSYTFLPFDFSGRGIFKINLSEIEGESDFDTSNSFKIIEGDVDGEKSFLVTLEYDGIDIKKNFSSKTISIDNIRPNFTSSTLITIPSEKSVAGIGDKIIFSPPTDSGGDNVLFSVDFSDIAGTVANFDDESGEQTITLLETNLENNNYIKSVYLKDDAGNTESANINTNAISVDLKLPIIQNSNLISIENGISPARYGSIINFKKPVDTNGNDITFSIDLSSLGGNEANFKKISDAQNFSVNFGLLQNESFSASFTIYDEAQNSATSTTNSILVDNKPPNFDTNCGATFVVLDKGDTNKIADFSAGEPDSVIFTAPNKNLSGCSDIESFSIDLSSLSGNISDKLENKIADGKNYLVSIGSGNLDSRTYTFPIRIFDIFNNYSDYSSGNLNIDNELLSKSDFEQSFSTSGKSSLLETFFYKDILNIKLSSNETNDLVSLQAQIKNATEKIDLQKTNGIWNGTLKIIAGNLKKVSKKIDFLGIDDQGNQFSFSSNSSFLINNDTTIYKGGGGGTSNLGNKSNSQRNFFNKSQSKKEKIWKNLREQELIFQKSLDQFKLKKSEESLPSFKKKTPKSEKVDLDELVKPLTYYEAFQLKMRVSRKKIEEKNINSDKLEKTIKKIILPSLKEKDWKKNEDKKGGFRIGNSLEKMKKASQKKSSKASINYRKTALNKRGKYGTIKISN